MWLKIKNNFISLNFNVYVKSIISQQYHAKAHGIIKNNKALSCELLNNSNNNNHATFQYIF